MGLCISECCDKDNCVECDVPYSYYLSDEHRSRKSCKVSKTGYHRFKEKCFR